MNLRHREEPNVRFSGDKMLFFTSNLFGAKKAENPAATDVKDAAKPERLWKPGARALSLKERVGL